MTIETNYEQRYKSLLRWTKKHFKQMEANSLSKTELLGCMSALQMLDQQSQDNWEKSLGISYNELYFKLENALEETS